MESQHEELAQKQMNDLMKSMDFEFEVPEPESPAFEIIGKGDKSGGAPVHFLQSAA